MNENITKRNALLAETVIRLEIPQHVRILRSKQRGCPETGTGINPGGKYHYHGRLHERP